MVLLYSDRLSRRIVTRPGFGGFVQSSRSSAALIEAITRSTSPREGWALSSGGMSWPSMYSRIRIQVRRRDRTVFSSRSDSRFRPAFGFSGPWQLAQCLARNGSTVRWKSPGSFATACAGRLPPVPPR